MHSRSRRRWTEHAARPPLAGQHTPDRDEAEPTIASVARFFWENAEDGGVRIGWQQLSAAEQAVWYRHVVGALAPMCARCDSLPFGDSDDPGPDHWDAIPPTTPVSKLLVTPPCAWTAAQTR